MARVSSPGGGESPKGKDETRYTAAGEAERNKDFGSFVTFAGNGKKYSITHNDSRNQGAIGLSRKDRKKREEMKKDLSNEALTLGGNGGEGLYHGLR